MKLPFTENRLSTKDCEIILRHEPFRHNKKHMIIIAIGIACLCGFGSLEVAQNIPIAIFTTIGVFVGCVIVMPWVFLWTTGQLWVSTDLIANITYVMGHLRWPPTWPSFLTESPIRIAWSEVTNVALRPVPWIFALENIQLELTLRSGKIYDLRVPSLTDSEYNGLIDVLRTIALRRGFHFSIEPALHTPIW